MINIIDAIFKHYKYICIENISLPTIKFYKVNDNKIASYFLVNIIDCKNIEKDEEKMKESIENLELVYSGNKNNEKNISLRKKIIESFSKVEEASQIDKNTSAIYLLLFSDLENLNKHRNLIYAIEESSNYFKRYILPYTDKQFENLKNILNQYNQEAINIKLSDIADDEDEYYKLLEGKNQDSV